MSLRIERGDILATLGAVLLAVSLKMVWYAISIKDLAAGFQIDRLTKTLGLRAGDSIIEKTGWQASTLAGLTLMIVVVATLGVVAARVFEIDVVNTPGHVIRGAGAAAVVLVVVRMILRPGLFPGAQSPMLTGLPGPHLALGIFVALIGGGLVLAAGFLMEMDGRAGALVDAGPPATWSAPVSAASTEPPDFLTSPPAWLAAPQGQPGPPPGSPPTYR